MGGNLFGHGTALEPEDLRVHFEHSRELIFVVDATDLRVLDANTVAAHRLGYSHRELLELDLPRMAPALSRDDLVAYLSRDRGDPHHFLTTELMAADGSVWPVEVSVSSAETAGAARYMIIAREIGNRRDAETALRESEARYRMLFEEMVSGFALHEIIYDDDGNPCDFRYLAVNPAFEKLTGLLAANIVGKRVREILPDIEPAWIERFGRVASTGQPARFEDFNRSLDKHFGVTAFCPRPGQFAITFTDITDRMSAEKALRKNEALFRAVIENMPSSFFVKNKEGRYLYVNQKHLDWHGNTAEEVIGKKTEDIVPPEFVEHYIELDRKVLENGEIQQRELELDYPDGRKRVTIGFKFPIVDEDGKITGIAGYGVDITDRKAAEQALAESERRYRNLIESSPLPFVVHSDNRIIFINSRAVTMFAGRSPSDFAGRSILDFVAPEAHEHAFQRTIDLYKGRIDFSVEEFPLIRLDGSRLIAEVVSRYIDFEGQPAVQVILNDISARKAAEQAARQLQDELAHVSRVSVMGEMAAGFAHELNQPLTAITNYSVGALRRIRSAGLSPSELERVLEKIGEQSRRAGEIIRRIRGFLAKEPQSLALIDLNDAITEAVGLLGSEALKHQVKIELRLQEDLPPATGDVIQIQQVVLNLARNAIEAMGESDGEPRQMTITTSLDDGGGLKVTIEDTGPGLDTNRIDRLFDPFFTTKAGGMGMGLSICRSIVQAHNGTLTARPRAPQGAVFEFTLPPGAREQEKE